MADVPTSPPVPPIIPVGLGTKLGVIVGAVAALCAALMPLLNGDQSTEVLGALAVAAVNFYAVVRGRMDQAAAAYTQPAGANPTYYYSTTGSTVG